MHNGTARLPGSCPEASFKGQLVQGLTGRLAGCTAAAAVLMLCTHLFCKYSRYSRYNIMVQTPADSLHVSKRVGYKLL
jgi:hypothetical protein